jgi:ribonuclease HI
MRKLRQNRTMLSRNEDLVQSSNIESDMLQWVGDGANTTWANALKANTLGRILEVLRDRIEVGAATPIKIKAHRGEPMNMEVDTLAETGREKEKETTKWTEKTKRLIFKWTGKKK